MTIKKLTMAVASSALLATAAWTAHALAQDQPAVAQPAAAPAKAQQPQAPAGTGTEAQLREQGRYLATAADCIACHTAKGGKPYAGGLGIASPIGTIYSPNITPDKATGIGGYSFEAFDNAVRRGIAKDGLTLYPAMPYPSYAKMKPSDVKALYAYFMHDVTPVERQNKATAIPWPLSMRWPLRFWRMAFAPDAVGEGVPGAPATTSETVARGRYLVEGAAHCGTCHTPRGLGLQERALTDDFRVYLSGGVVDGYVAKNLRGDRKDGLGEWTPEQIVAFLKSGRNTHAAAFGGMAEVVQRSTQNMSDADLEAIAVYLKTLSPANPAQSPLAADATATQQLRAGTDRSNGALTFVDNCAACHRTSGSGYESTFPTLALSSVVNSDDPTSLIHIVLKGGQMPWTKAAPTHYGMPGFAARLTDRDIADVLTFARSSWGNRAPAVSASDVAKVRKAVRAAPQPARPENG